MHRPGTALEKLREQVAAEEARHATREQKRLRMLASITPSQVLLLARIVEACVHETIHKRPILNNRSRTIHTCFTRHLAMYLARELTTLSWEQIGAYFDRDHSTVIHSHQIDTPAFKQVLLRIISAVRQSTTQEAAA